MSSSDNRRDSRGAAVALAALFAALLAALRVSSAGAQTVTRHETLASLGFPQGVTLTNVAESQDLYFHGTSGPVPAKGHLHLELATVVRQFRTAFIQISVDEVPRVTRDVNVGLVSDTAMTIDLDLTADALVRPFVRVSLRFGGRLPGDSCYDWRRNATAISIGAASSLTLTYDARAVTTIDAAWALLPQSVMVALPPAPLDAGEFRAAWEVGTALVRAGHDVRYGSAPDAESVASDSVGVVVVNNDRQESASTHAQSGRDNVALASVGGRPTIVVHDGFPASRVLQQPWQPVTESLRLTAVGQRQRTDMRAIVSLQELGVPLAAQALARESEWTVPLPASDLQPGTIPARLNLDVVVGVTPDRQGVAADVFLNDVLIRSASLDESGRPQRITAEVPPTAVAVANTLRLVLRRRIATSPAPVVGECRAIPDPVPAELLGSSTIEGRRVDELHDFRELPAVLHRGFDVDLPDSVLRSPETSLPFLARLAAVALPLDDVVRLVFYGRDVPRPGRPFVLLATNAATLDGPVRLVGGVLHTANGLAISGTADVVILEIAKLGAERGLAMLPLNPAHLATPPTIALSAGDLAMVTGDGTEVSSVLEGPAGPLARYVYWLAAVVALVVAVGLVYIARRIRRRVA